MKKRLFTSHLILVLCGLVIAFLVSIDSKTAVQNPGSKGSFTKCTYTSNLSDSGYSSAMVYYPCERSSGPFPATTLTGGYTNTYSDMSWIADHVVTHGFIVIGMTPNNNLGNNSQWTTAHKAGIAKLKSENTRSASPIYGIVDTANLQVMGYSKGGGGALLAAASLGTQLQSTQAFAPYMDGSYNLSGIRADTICYTGTSDSIASPSKVVDMYNSLPDSIERTLGYFNGFSHLTWINSGSSSYHNQALVYITSWMKYYLDGDAGYETYLYGAEHEDHMDANWFDDYAHNEDTGGGGGCSF
ncbi:MAG: hypothetical protein A2W19_03225 [Spirochaetes bacterium RBG_16_49_21]|nr:MAG: hypothetical protein A2W19_03225 [Spirochaetes bacterium RBG_16_49_21]